MLSAIPWELFPGQAVSNPERNCASLNILVIRALQAEDQWMVSHSGNQDFYLE